MVRTDSGGGCGNNLHLFRLVICGTGCISVRTALDKLLNGTVYTREVDGWSISWESNGAYRHWCFQQHPANDRTILVVMLNPGSLQGDGKDLTKDTTLRILREVFETTGLNPFIINLFDLATPSPKELFSNWGKRDSDKLIYENIKHEHFSGILYAYGDYGVADVDYPEIADRIGLVKRNFKRLPEVELPQNIDGTPKHPMGWQRQKMKPQIKTIIKAFNMRAV